MRDKQVGPRILIPISLKKKQVQKREVLLTLKQHRLERGFSFSINIQLVLSVSPDFLPADSTKAVQGMIVI